MNFILADYSKLIASKLDTFKKMPNLSLFLSVGKCQLATLFPFPRALDARPKSMFCATTGGRKKKGREAIDNSERRPINESRVPREKHSSLSSFTKGKESFFFLPFSP